MSLDQGMFARCRVRRLDDLCLVACIDDESVDVVGDSKDTAAKKNVAVVAGVGGGVGGEKNAAAKVVDVVVGRITLELEAGLVRLRGRQEASGDALLLEIGLAVDGSGVEKAGVLGRGGREKQDVGGYSLIGADTDDAADGQISPLTRNEGLGRSKKR